MTVREIDRPDIRVGDRVRREPPVRGGVTIEFTVNRIHEGLIYPAYGVGDALVGYSPERFQVLARAE